MSYLVKLNLPEIDEVLDLHGVKSIYDVIGRMKVMLDLCEEHSELKFLRPFFYTYYLVTKRVATTYLESKSAFQNAEEVEKLDIVFASLFFQPLKEYLHQRTIPAPWRNYFAYNRTDPHAAFVSLLLGINAHINGDLAVALKLAKVENYADFNKINSILLEVIPEVMRNLAYNEHDIWGAGGLILKQYAEAEFRELIVGWRSQAWANYQQLQRRGGFIRRGLLRRNTELAANRIINIFASHSLIGAMKIVNELNIVTVKL